MQIIGFNFEKISVEKKKQLGGKIEIKQNINIKEISSEKIDLFKDKDALKFGFEFIVNYSPDIAELKFTGIVVSVMEKEKTKEILKKWKNKKISDDVRLPLFNFILTKCNIKALQFEEEFNLPMHIPMPKLNPPQNNQGYVQ